MPSSGRGDVEASQASAGGYRCEPPAVAWLHPMSEAQPANEPHRDGVRAVAAARHRGRSGSACPSACSHALPAWVSLAPIVMSVTTFAGLGAVRRGARSWAPAAARRGRDHGRAPAERPVRPDRRQRRAVPHAAAWWSGSCTPSSWSTSRGRSPPRARGGSTRRSCWAPGVTLYVAWVGGTILGVAVRRRDRRPRSAGDSTPRSRRCSSRCWCRSSRRRRAVGSRRCSAPAIALALTPFTPAGVPIIAASAACLLGLRDDGDHDRGAAR